MSSSSEDALCIGRIQSTKEYAEEDGVAYDIQTEKHYNHYGDRGVADLFVRTTHPNGSQEDTVYEFKSESAVEEATGANEIIRQFNRMCTYFYKDETIDLPKASSLSVPDTSFLLIFETTPETVDHVVQNFEIYDTVISPVDPTGIRGTVSSVMFEDPDERDVFLVTNSTENERLSRERVVDFAEKTFGLEYDLGGDGQ